MSKIKVDNIQSTQHATSTIGLTSTGATINGDCSATTFTGSGANLTSLPSANLTGAIPANLLTNAGGGGFEFVSKSEVASGQTAAYIDFTSLSDDSMYRVVGKQVVNSSSSFEQYEFLDTSGNPISGKLNYTRVYGTTSYSYNGWTTQDAFYGAGLADASSSKGAFILEFFTKAGQVWFRFDGTTTNGTRAYMETWGNFDSSDTTTQIGGLRIRDASGTSNTLQAGTQILLYKYKES